MGKPLSQLKVAGLTLALGGLTASAAMLACAPGYLTVVGPAPLRFEPAPVPGAARPLLLPPLAQVLQRERARAAASTNAPAPNAPASPAPSPAEAMEAAPPATQPETGLQLPPLIRHNETAPEAALTPQAFLGYLLPLPTNTPAEPLQVPAFVPPVVPEPPSSKATYESR